MERYNRILENIARHEASSQRDAESFSRFINLLPKVEIHLHVEALLTADDLQKLNEKNGLYPECKTAEELRDKLNLRKIRDLNAMIQQFLKIQTFFKSEEDFALITESIPRYMEKNQIKYMEVHFSPSSFLKHGMKFDGMVSNLEKAISQVCRENQVDVRIIIDLSRTFGVKNAFNNLNCVKEYLSSHKDSRIIAVGLGGAEKAGTPEEYGPVFFQAHEWGIRTVAHGGEDSGPEQLWATLKHLNPLRIGHGTSSFMEEALMQELKDRGIPLEICPTSNVVTGRFMKTMAEHPVRIFYDKGLMVTLNTDDPSIFGIELNDEYMNLYNELNFSVYEIVQVLINTYKSSFMTEEQKKNSLNKLYEALEPAIKKTYPDFI